MVKIKKMGIWITEKCPLRCSFCENSDDYFKNAKNMNLETFKNKVDEIVQNNIEIIDLTPLVGEILNLKNIEDYFNVLDNNDHIKEYSFITCLITNKRNIEKLTNRPKLKLEISLYGLDKEEYKLRTNKDLFNNFISNLKYLLKIYDKKITIINRTSIDDIKLLERKMSPQLKFLLKKCDTDDEWVIDRKNYSEIMHQKNIQEFKCHWMTEPVMNNDGICYCCFDSKKEFISKKSIKELYKKDNFFNHIKKVKVCNEKCGWFKPLKDE